MDLKTKRWLVLVSSIIFNFCVGGSIYTWSVFAKPVVVLLGTTTAAATLAFTIANLASPTTMIGCGKLQDKFGPKWIIFFGAFFFGGGVFLCGYTSSIIWLYICYGVISGLGGGAIYICAISNAIKWFPDKRGFVAGLVAAGGGAGSVVVAPLANWLIANYGVLSAFKVLGLSIVIIVAVFSQFIEKAPDSDKPEECNSEKTDDSTVVAGINKNWNEMLADPMFYVLMVMLLIGSFSGLMIISQASVLVQDVIKVTPATAALVVSILALANTVGRFFWGWASDRIGRFAAITAMYIISGIMMFSLTTVSSLTPFILVVLAVGFCYGGLMGVFPALTADTFGPKNSGVNFGIMMLGFSISSFLGPITAAKVKMASGGYTLAFIIASIMTIIGILLTQYVRCKYRKTQDVRLTDV